MVSCQRRGGDELGAGDLGGVVSVQEDVAGAEVMRLQVSQCAGDVDSVVPAGGRAASGDRARRGGPLVCRRTARVAHWRNRRRED